jgi:predicted heme/steroid binding protein
MQEFSTEELAKFDGKNGNKAYVAVDGNVYDVTPIPAWKDGVHHAGAHAGADMSDFITRSPHGKKVLQKLTQVGTLAA